MADVKQFDLSADPFRTGFEVKDEITTDEVIRFVNDRRSFIPKDDDVPLTDPVWWKANCKAAIKGGWFTAPDWKPADVGGWPLAQTRWLAQWCIAKYEDMITVPLA